MLTALRAVAFQQFEDLVGKKNKEKLWRFSYTNSYLRKTNFSLGRNNLVKFKRTLVQRVSVDGQYYTTNDLKRLCTAPVS